MVTRPGPGRAPRVGPSSDVGPEYETRREKVLPLKRKRDLSHFFEFLEVLGVLGSQPFESLKRG